MTTRKQVAQALLNLLAPAGSPYGQNTGLRDRAPEQAAVPSKPALYLIKPRENYAYDEGERGVPPIRTFDYLAVIYTDVGDDDTAVPQNVIDDLLDAMDAAIAPTGADMLNGNQQTLGGLVQDCRIEGELDIASGDVEGKGTTIVPIRVVVKDYP